MGCLALFVLLLIALPVIFILVFLNVVSISFGKLGLSQNAAVVLLLATLIGSLINIPISRRRVILEEPQPMFRRFFFYTPPRVTEQVLAVNVGGALIPIAFAAYLWPRAPVLPTLIALGVIIIVTRFVSRPVRGSGIVMPVWIAPLLSAGLAFLLSRNNPAPVAYISGTVGTLIGADLLHWPDFDKLGAQFISIGGAGVFDGIFITGIIAVLIA